MADLRAVPARVEWDWSDAALGALYAAPAALAMVGSVPAGLALGVAALPAAVVGLKPTRRARVAVVVVGVMAGVSLFIGSLLAGVGWWAVPALFALALGMVQLARWRAVGQILLGLALPLVGVGLSYTDHAEAGGLALAMVAGSVWALLVSMAWPDRDAPGVADLPPPPTVDYGVRLGLAAASAAAIGLALDLEHVGWACAAVLLVMRPSAQLQRLRSEGRVLSVVLGATAAGLLARLTTQAGWYALAVLAVLAAAAATHHSRWYVTPAFATFLALSLSEYSHPSQVGSRWVERVAETLLGVGLAGFFGLGVPALRTWWAGRLTAVVATRSG